MTGLPESIQIQTTTKCTRRCPWCPNYKLGEHEMDTEVLSQILDKLVAVGYQGRLHPYLMAEPLTDERLPWIIASIRMRFPENVIFIYTNGDLLDERKVDQLWENGLSGMCVTLYDNVHVGKIMKLVQKYPSFIHLEYGVPEPYNRAGHVEVHCSRPKKVCEWVFTKAYVNWKGEMILCCSDYEFEVVIGDLKEENFLGVWDCHHYWSYRDHHRQGVGGKLPLCERCNRIGGQENGKSRTNRAST